MTMKIIPERRNYRTWWMAAFALIAGVFIGLLVTQPRTQHLHTPITPPASRPDPEWFRFRLPAALEHRGETDQRIATDTVDLSSEESFPASDAPGWIRQRV